MVAKKENLEIPAGSPGLYFGDLNKRRAKYTGAKVAALIGERDAPATGNMGDLKVAKANADILSRFLAIVKDGLVTRSAGFTLFMAPLATSF